MRINHSGNGNKGDGDVYIELKSFNSGLTRRRSPVSQVTNHSVTVKLPPVESPVVWNLIVASSTKPRGAASATAMITG